LGQAAPRDCAGRILVRAIAVSDRHRYACLLDPPSKMLCLAFVATIVLQTACAFVSLHVLRGVAALVPAPLSGARLCPFFVGCALASAAA
jgi:hypothetical protein